MVNIDITNEAYKSATNMGQGIMKLLEPCIKQGKIKLPVPIKEEERSL